MDANKSQNTAENKSLDEFDISSATGMDPKDEKICKLESELQQIKEANSNQFGGSTMMQMASQIDEKFGKMEKELDGLKSAKDEVNSAFKGLKEEFGKMAGENAGLKEKMAKMEKEFAGKNEEMGKMKAEFDQKIVEFEGMMRKSLEKKADKEMLVQFKNNRWNAVDCGPKLVISEGGLVMKLSAGHYGVNSIRAILPIPLFNLDSTNPSIAGYYEVQIVHMDSRIIRIGFCTQQFPLEGKCLGDEANSIGIRLLSVMGIGIRPNSGMYIDGQFKKFGKNASEYFKVGDVIGLGIIHFPANKSMKCFVTSNGQLLETFELPDKFASLQLYPAATLYYANDSIRANFGLETFGFDASQLLK